MIAALGIVNEKMKHLTKLILTLYLAILYGCTISIGNTSLKGKIFDEANVQVLSKNISINGEDILAGKEISYKAGEIVIDYKGELLRKKLIATDNTKTNNNIMSDLGCFLLLPICMLTAAASGVSSEPIYEFIPSYCDARLTVQIEAGHKYIIKTNEKTTDYPILSIDRKSSPSFTISEEIMSCKDLDNTT